MIVEGEGEDESVQEILALGPKISYVMVMEIFVY
jgi:hypothetical protein